MKKYLNHIWDGNFSFEQFLDLIITDPDGLHVYDAGMEYEIGRWYQDRKPKWVNELLTTLATQYLKNLKKYLRCMIKTLT